MAYGLSQGQYGVNPTGSQGPNPGGNATPAGSNFGGFGGFGQMGYASPYGSNSNPGSVSQSMQGLLGGAGAGSNVSYYNPGTGAQVNLTPNLIPQQEQAQLTEMGAGAGYEQQLAGQQANYQRQLAAQQAAAEQALQSGSFAGQQGLEAQKAQLLGQLFNQRFGAISGLMNQYLGGVNGIFGPSGTIASQLPTALTDAEAQARSAAMGQAKQTAGNQALSGLQAVQNLADERGITGSSAENQLLAPVLQNATNQTGQANLDIMNQNLSRYAQISDLLANLGIQARGQTLGALTGLYGALGSGFGL